MNGTRFEFHPPYWCDVDVLAMYDSGRVLIVRPQEDGPVTGGRYVDVWVGPDENRGCVGSCNDLYGAEFIAANYRHN